MLIRSHAYARAGLIGNPSDGYFGKTISIILRNFAATATIYETPRISIRRRKPTLEYDNLDHLMRDIQQNGYYGAVRLIRAAIKRFKDYADQHGIDLPPRNFTIEYDTDIPVRVGLAGSSGIVTATMRALLAFYGVEIPKPILPQVILDVELKELGIGAGLQDRVIQVYEGVVFMDFDRTNMEAAGHGAYEPLDPGLLPPLFVAYHDHLAEGTEITHNDLRSRFNRGDSDVHEAIATWAGLAQQARDLLVAGRGSRIGPLMDQNFDLRARLIPISEGNRQLIAIARRHGAHAKFAGSGGAIIAAYDGDPVRLARLTAEYQAMGARVITPAVTE